MTSKKKYQFEQEYARVTNQIPYDQQELSKLDWISYGVNYYPYIPVALLLQLTDEKINLLKELYEKYA